MVPRARAEGYSPELWAASEEDAAALAPRLARVQTGGDLGRRMQRALADAIGRAGRAVLIGSDVPTLSPARLAEARRHLAGERVVLGPSVDGGFYLVGASARAPDLEAPIRWSTRHALADTRRALEGRPVRLLAPHYDVDEPEDLDLLRTHLDLAPGAAPHTAEALAALLTR